MPGMFAADDVDESTSAPAPPKRGKFSASDIDHVKPKHGKFSAADIESRPGTVNSTQSSDQADADRPASAQPEVTPAPKPEPKVK